MRGGSAREVNERVMVYTCRFAAVRVNALASTTRPTSTITNESRESTLGESRGYWISTSAPKLSSLAASVWAAPAPR
jgi:hypothetical protein